MGSSYFRVSISGLFCIVVVLVAAALVVAFHLSRPKEQVKCSDFDTRLEAQRKYEQGATWLDADNDRIACENLSYD